MEENNQRTPFPFFGILLILIGFGILFDKLEVLSFSWNKLWQFIVVALGLWMVITAFFYNQKGKIFGGTFLFLFGVFFLLISYSFIPFNPIVVVPGLILILGLSFLMLFVFEPRDWGVLIPSLIFIGVALTIMFSKLGYMKYWQVWHYLGTYWPIILVLIGLSLIFKRRSRE